jgi:hypothetical protein
MDGDLADAIALLRRARRTVESDAQMMDDIDRHRVMPYGGAEEASVRVAANTGYVLLGEIDVLLTKYPETTCEHEPNR